MQANRDVDYAGAAASIQRGCTLGFEAACANRNAIRVAGALKSAPPTLADMPIVLRGSKGPIRDQSPPALFALACREGWPGTCAPDP
jgi:hypothetical protein